MLATRSVGIQKYFPVVVSTSKNPACRSSDIAKIVEWRRSLGVRRRRAAGRVSASAACRATSSAMSPARSATRAARAGAQRRGGLAEKFRNPALAPCCRRAISARISWRNSATTIADVGSILRGGIEDVVGAFEIAGKQQQFGQQHARPEIAPGCCAPRHWPRRSPRRACRLGTMHRRFAQLPAPRSVPYAVTPGAVISVTQTERRRHVVELKMRLQMHRAAKNARPARPLAHRDAGARPRGSAPGFPGRPTDCEFT